MRGTLQESAKPVKRPRSLDRHLQGVPPDNWLRSEGVKSAGSTVRYRSVQLTCEKLSLAHPSTKVHTSMVVSCER